MKKTLAETNPYIRSPKKRLRFIIRNARQSSILEGARGLMTDGIQSEVSSPRASALSKKADSAS